MSAHWPEVSNGVTESLFLVTTLRVCIRRGSRPLLFLSSKEQVKQRIWWRPNHVLLRQMKDFTWGIFWIIQKNHCLKFCMQKMNFLFFLWRTQCTGYTLPIHSQPPWKARMLSSHSLPQKEEEATQRASPERPLESGGQLLLPCPSFNLESHTHRAPKQMATYTASSSPTRTDDPGSNYQSCCSHGYLHDYIWWMPETNQK